MNTDNLTDKQKISLQKLHGGTNKRIEKGSEKHCRNNNV